MSKVHLVKKRDIRSHAIIDLPSPPEGQQSLPKDHVRVKTKLISLSSNNVTYAWLGSLRNWWDTYPVSPDFPSPYTDAAEWGIVPAWGFGEIVESNVPSLQKGQLLFGFWPTSSLPIDLHLQQDRAYSRLFKELSPHRANLMNLYNDYLVTPEHEAGGDEERLAWKTGGVIWATGYNLVNYVFHHDEAVTPLEGVPWSREDADVRSTVIVQLGASSSTGRSTTWNFCQRSHQDAPRGLLEVSSSPQPAAAAVASFPRKAVSYADLTAADTISWLAELSPLRIVLINYNGGGSGLARQFYDTVRAEKPGVKFLHFVVAGDMEAIPEEEGWTRVVRSNMSSQRDAIIAKLGMEGYQSGLEKAWDRWYESKGMGGNQLAWGEGVAGEEGIEGRWKMLTAGGGEGRAGKELVVRV